MSRGHDLFFTRDGIAHYLEITRMTLSRWEKSLPLPNQGKSWRLRTLTKNELDTWKRKLHLIFHDQRKKGYAYILRM